MRLVTSLRMTGENWREIARTSAVGETSRLAFVLSSSVHLDMTRMYAIYRLLAGGDEAIRSFVDIESAMKWLGLPSDCAACAGTLVAA